MGAGKGALFVWLWFTGSDWVECLVSCMQPPQKRPKLSATTSYLTWRCDRVPRSRGYDFCKKKLKPPIARVTILFLAILWACMRCGVSVHFHISILLCWSRLAYGAYKFDDVLLKWQNMWLHLMMFFQFCWSETLSMRRFCENFDVLKLGKNTAN